MKATFQYNFSVIIVYNNRAYIYMMGKIPKFENLYLFVITYWNLRIGRITKD